MDARTRSVLVRTIKEIASKTEKAHFITDESEDFFHSLPDDALATCVADWWSELLQELEGLDDREFYVKYGRGIVISNRVE